jgi:hypothetical protein
VQHVALIHSSNNHGKRYSGYRVKA